MNCHHCGQPAVAGLSCDGHDFCCRGCRGVYTFVRDSGLDDYYGFRDNLAAGPVAETLAADAYYSQPEVAAQFYMDGAFHLILDGMHCAACAWLVEKVLSRIEGVSRVEVNYALARCRVVGSPRLSSLLQAVSRLGYRAIPYDPNRQERPLLRQESLRLLRLGVAAFSTGNVMLLAFALYTGADQERGFRELFHWISLALSLPVVLYSAQPFWQGALAALRERTLTTDVTISLGLAVTWTSSVVATLTGHGQVYFDTASTFVFVLLVARLLESAARLRSGSVMERLLSLHARTARKLDGTEVAVDTLAPGDLVEVRPGDKVPADGLVVEGSSYLDEASLTGESAPRAAAPGARVYGGSVSLDGRLVVRLEKTGASTMLAQIAAFVESCQSAASPTQRVVDRIARYFLSGVLVAALLTGLAGHWDNAVTVLIITCPCALGISAPLLVAVAAGRGAGRGVLFRGGAALERLADVTHVVLDKTGTVTLGELTVQNKVPFEWLRLAAAVESGSTHPLARAIVRAAGGMELPPVEDFRCEAGSGVSGVVEGRRVRVGSPAFLGLPDTPGVHLSVDGEHKATFHLTDEVRPEAAAVVGELRKHGLEVWMASGDLRECVEKVASSVGISRWFGRCLPLDKVELVRGLQARGAVVAVVGDGNNDAPVLAAADVGIAVASASELSTESADWVLVAKGLQPLLEARALAEEGRWRLRLSIGVAALYNTIAIPAAMLGWVTPLVAAIAMPVSSLVVVANSLLLKGRS